MQSRKRKATKQKYKRFKPTQRSAVKLPKGELKYDDRDKSQVTVAATGTVLQDTLPGYITSGTGESERIGRKITVTSIMLRGRIILPSTQTVGDTTDTVRLIIYVDRQTNQAAASVSNILSDLSINSFRNLDNSTRFQILHDVTYAMKSRGGAGNGTTDTYVEDVRYLRIYKRCSINIEYSTGNGDVGDLTQNNIGIMAISSSGKANIKFTTRLRYSDK